MKTTAIISLDPESSIEISTTISQLHNGKEINIDLDKITLYDYFALEERLEKTLKILKYAAQQNSLRRFKPKVIYSVNNPYFKG